MAYQYSAGELTPYRNNPNRRMPAAGGQLGQTYAEYMASQGGSGAGGWLEADKERRAQEAAERAKPEPSLEILYRRREYIRDLMKNYGKTALADEARMATRERGQLAEDVRSRGFYSSTVYDALKNRQQESQSRRRGAIQEQIATSKANVEYGLTGDIANMLDEQRARAAGYAYQSAAGRASSKAQEQQQLMSTAALVFAAMV